MPLATISRLIGKLKLLPVRVSVHRRRRILSIRHLLILLFKRMSVDVVEFLKRTAGHWGRLHTFLLKKLQILWSNECLWQLYRGLSAN